MIDLTTPEPPLTPPEPEPEPERGHWCYGVWVADEREWEGEE